MNRSLESLRLQVERAHQRRAAGISLALFLAVLALCFFFTAYSISIPPPGDQYVAVGIADFGEVDRASGDNESEVPSEMLQEAVEEAVASSETAVTPEVEEIVTQAESEVSVPTSPDPTQEKQDQEPEDPAQTVSTALSSRLGALSAGGGGSQGTSSEGTGNEGDEEGDMFANGTTVGNVTWGIIGGGEILGYPQQEKDPTATGTVRVLLVVDGNGKVLTADYDPINSTLTDVYHVRIAQEAAKTATFSPDRSKVRRRAFLDIRYELE
jgi:outer membrane biosynthesis protein TonB